MPRPLGLIERVKRLSHLTPHLDHNIEHLRVMLLEFGPGKWIEIVDPKIGLGAFRKILLVIRQRVVPYLAPCVKKDVLVNTLSLHVVIGGKNIPILKGEDLIMVSMGKFVQNHIWMLSPSMTVDESFSSRYVNMLLQPRVMTVCHQPTLGWMVLHGSEPMRAVEDNG